MTDRPIIFSAPMVRALIDGRKTQTRRIVKNVPNAPAMDNIAWPDKKLRPSPYLDAYCGARRTAENPRGMTANWAYWTRDDRPGPLFRVGYVPGQRLWVREAWKSDRAYDDLAPSEMGGEEPLIYVADNEVQRWGWNPDVLSRLGRYRHARFMPRWASRLTLTVTDVRMQRLHEISDADAVAEGITPHGGLFLGSGTQADIWMSAINSFHSLWNGIHGPDAWSANPWVCALTFTVDPRNIDVDTAPKDQAG
jgi:hypothetical protein